MIDLVLLYYNQPAMLQRQLDEFTHYPPDIRPVVIDDGSDTPAEPIIKASGQDVALYRVDVDIPWHQEGARNLGAHVAGEWQLHLDMDHLLPADAAHMLAAHKLDVRRWYRFPRIRIGKADETRRKDRGNPDCDHQPIHPHINSFLITRETYWKAGGYDEDYDGMLGGDGPFLKQLVEAAGQPIMMPPEIPLHVYTRHAVPDANITTLDRDTSRFQALKKQKGYIKGARPIRFPWHRVC